MKLALSLYLCASLRTEILVNGFVQNSLLSPKTQPLTFMSMVTGGANAGPAGSHDEDMELTRQVLMGGTQTLDSDDDKSLMLDLTSKLIQILPRKKHVSWLGKVHKDTFTGEEATTLFCDKLDGINNEEDAVRFAKFLLSKKIMHCMNSDSDDVQYVRFNGKGDKQLYRLQPFHNPNVLNSYRVWSLESEPTSDNAMTVLKQLESMFEKLENKATDSDGKVNYVAIPNDPDYLKFEDAVCEIQMISMENMDDKTKLAYGISVYNLMIKYAFVKVGIPSSNLQRLGFFGAVSFDIGGYIYSFNDLENGILRANSKAPYALSTPFSPSSNDPRLDFIVQNFDPRIHFALNCGAISCPPVKKYTSDDIESELETATFEFTDNDENFLIDEEKNELKVSMILNWFSTDFAPSKDVLAESIVKFVRGDKKEKLQNMIDQQSKKPIKVTFHPYDWGTNASNLKQYDSSVLSSDYFSLRELGKKMLFMNP